MRSISRGLIVRPGRGFFAVGVANAKHEVNVGTLWRSAQHYGAAFVFTVGRRYHPQASDTAATPRHTPLFHFTDIDDLIEHLPWSMPLIGVELDVDAVPLSRFPHPMRACYLLGAEDHGLTRVQMDRCHRLVQIPGPSPQSMNVAVAGSIVMYDRYMKEVAGTLVDRV